MSKDGESAGAGPEDTEAESAELSEPKKAFKPSILIVEDDKDSYVQSLSALLSQGPRFEFANVEVQQDYSKALDQLRDAPSFDLIVVDVRLTESAEDEAKSGLDFVRALRADDTPIVVVSSDPGVDEEALRAGADLSLPRPENPEDLRSVLESQIVSSWIRRERSTCFVSFSSRDDKIARRLHKDLEENGVACWFAPHDLPIGAKTREDIHSAIQSHDKLLLILSRNSVSSEWVEDEVEKALELEGIHKSLVLFPIRIDKAVMNVKMGWPATIRNTRNIGDFSSWENPTAYSASLTRLLRDLRKQVE